MNKKKSFYSLIFLFSILLNFNGFGSTGEEEKQPDRPVSQSSASTVIYPGSTSLMPPPPYTDERGSPIGIMSPYAGITAPEGWLLCNGNSVSKDEFRALFEVIGTRYGGDGETHFNLPDMRGRSAVGCLFMGNREPAGVLPFERIPPGATSVVGFPIGQASMRLESHHLPPHQHEMVTGFSGGSNDNSSSDEEGPARGPRVAHTHAHSEVAPKINTGIAGRGDSFSLVPPGLFLSHIIRAR